MSLDNDPNGKKQKDIIHFPTLKERDRAARKKREAEAASKKKGGKWSMSYKGKGWGSGDGSPVGPNSRGNGGNKPHEPFIKFGNIPVFTRAIVFTFLVVHIILSLLLTKAGLWDVRTIFTFIPGYFTGHIGMTSLLSVFSPITYLFLHAGWMHMIFNGIMMLAFGMFVEKRLGSKITAFFFFSGGLSGALAFLILHPMSDTQLLGASAGISSLFGVAMIAMYTERQMSGAPMGNGLASKGPWPIVALWVVIMAVTGSIGGGSVAWQAHIAGFLSGAFLYRMMQKGRLKL